jgi:hypothetical protein
VFDKLQEHQLFFKRSKSFGMRTAAYLSHDISAEGVDMDEQKVQAVLSWPVAASVHAVRMFLELAGYYRCFIHNFGYCRCFIHNSALVHAVLLTGHTIHVCQYWTYGRGQEGTFLVWD